MYVPESRLVVDQRGEPLVCGTCGQTEHCLGSAVPSDSAAVVVEREGRRRREVGRREEGGEREGERGREGEGGGRRERGMERREGGHTCRFHGHV